MRRERAQLSVACRMVMNAADTVEVAANAYRFSEAQRMMDELLALYPEDQGV